jgi:hypothetical protein
VEFPLRRQRASRIPQDSENLAPMGKGEPLCLSEGYFRNVSQRRIQQDSISLNLDFQLRINNFHSA